MRLLAIVTLCALVYGVLPFIIQKNSFDNRPHGTQFEKPGKTFDKVSLKAFVDSLPKSMTFLGTTSDGKAIFSESTLMSWQDARTFCQTANLRLLRIMSQEQLRFIGESGPEEDHWVGARESRSVEGFVWDTEIFTEPIVFWDTFGSEGESPWNPYHSCLSMKKTSDGSLLYNKLCSQQLKVLCEAEFSNTDVK